MPSTSRIVIHQASLGMTVVWELKRCRRRSWILYEKEGVLGSYRQAREARRANRRSRGRYALTPVPRPITQTFRMLRQLP
jgi:hypothetical protein